jgi:phenylacetate-CoA ligase
MAYGARWQRQLYDRAPAALKNLITSVYGLQQRRARYGRHYVEALATLAEEERMTSDALVERQLVRVRSFLSRAQRDSMFHRARFAEAGFSPDQLRSLDDLRALPVMTKEEIRANADRIASSRLRDLDVRWLHTSGTTGKALHIPMAASAFQREYAFRASHYRWGGIELDGGDRLAFAFGHPVTPASRSEPPFWSYDHANGWLLMSSYHLGERQLGAYIRELERFRPAMIAGYPSSLYLLALAHERYGTGRFRPRSAFAASETLLEHQRIAIERGFGCRVLVWYGNTEMCANIVECASGSLHGRLEHSYLEVLDDAGRPAREGHLVCTGFGNDAFPLIRYDIGDVVERSDARACDCGRPGVFFRRILGRVEDYVITPDGRYIGRLDHLFKDALRVREAQLVQVSPDALKIRLVVREGYGPADEQQIASEARSRLGDAISLRFEYVDTIERTPAGKFRFVVSSVHGRTGPSS